MNLTKSKLYTIGHSNRTIDRFVDLLNDHGVKKIVDVRTIPKSHDNPLFNQNEIRKSLTSAKIRYEHLKVLGGLRHTVYVQEIDEGLRCNR